MFTAPFNGPATSFDINQDSLNLYNTLLALFPGINNPPHIIDLDNVQVELPHITESLQVLLPNFTCVFDGIETTLPLTSYQLPPNSDNYIVLTSMGKGKNADLNQSEFQVLRSGPYSGYYAPPLTGYTNLIQSAVPLSLLEGQELKQTWVVNISGSGTFLGPNMLDSQGNGFAMLLTKTDAYLYYMANYCIQYLAGSTSGTLMTNGLNSISLGITYSGAGESLYSSKIAVQCYINRSNLANISYTSFSTFMNPFQVYPGYYFSYNTPYPSYVRSWLWQYEGGSYPVVWGNKTVALGSPQPALPGMIPVFICSTGATAILSVINSTENLNLFAQISYMADTVNQIYGAYM